MKELGQRLEVVAFNDQIGAEAGGMPGAQGGVVAAQNDARIRTATAQLFDDLRHTRIPVGHYSLNQSDVERAARRQQVAKVGTGQTKPVVAARNGLQGRRFLDLGGEKPAPAPAVLLELGRYRRMQPVQEVEENQIGRVTQLAGNPQQAVRLEPEIIRRKIVDRRIYQQYAGHHFSEFDGLGEHAEAPRSKIAGGQIAYKHD